MMLALWNKSSFNEPRSLMDDNLCVNMKGYLILGRIFGLIPFTGICGSNHTSLKFKKISLPVFYNGILILLLGFSTTLSLFNTMQYPKSNALDIADAGYLIVYNAWGFFCYMYFVTQAGPLNYIFRKWEQSSLFYFSYDNTYKRDVIILLIVIFGSGICETSLFQLEFFPQFDQIIRPADHRNSSLETYYMRSHGYWNKYLGYDPVLGIMAFIADMVIVICWNYVDCLLIIFARAIYIKFKRLCLVAQENLDEYLSLSMQSTRKPFNKTDQLVWDKIVSDHDTLCRILDAIQTFVSPLIFGSYATNIYFICLQLIYDITPAKGNESWIRSIRSPISFLNIIMRVFILTLVASRIHKYAHSLGNILKKCPIELYSDEVQRLHKQVTAGSDIGLSGLGCFTITTPFMLSILNVIYTIEIVLLSSNSASQSCSNDLVLNTIIR